MSPDLCHDVPRALIPLIYILRPGLDNLQRTREDIRRGLSHAATHYEVGRAKLAPLLREPPFLESLVYGELDGAVADGEEGGRETDEETAGTFLGDDVL